MRRACWCIGDAVTNLDGLQVLPEKYCADLPLLLDSLRIFAHWSSTSFASRMDFRSSANAKQRVAEVV